MKVLITGATGFIGSQLALEARAAGHDVIVTGLITNSAERDRSERLARAGLRLIDGLRLGLMTPSPGCVGLARFGGGVMMTKAIP